MFLTQIVNGKMSEMALCEECAKARGLFDPQSLTFSEKFFPEELKRQMDRIVQQLSGGGSEPERRQPAAVEGRDVITACPVCRFTLEDYRRTGRLGCPDCYTFLAAELDSCSGAQAEDDAEAEQETAPENPMPRAQRPTVANLSDELQRAVEREDYELAAHLRDQIKAFENNQNPTEGNHQA